MFDIGASELLVLVIVAIVVIGPKDLPLALRTAGKWVAKMRRMASHFQAGVDVMIREAELDEMERKWQADNERIMAESEARAKEAEGGATALSAPETPPIDAVIKP